jgi:uncharacterized protein (DUF2141 family)
MKIIPICSLCGLFFLVSIFALAQEQPKEGNLQIVVNQFNNDQGQALVCLYRPGDKLFKTESAFRIISAKIVHGQIEVTFKNLPFGRYAFFAFHDENNNRKVDHHWYGLPMEQMGFSNNVKVSLTSGIPDFEKLAFSFSEKNSELVVHLQGKDL